MLIEPAFPPEVDTTPVTVFFSDGDGEGEEENEDVMDDGHTKKTSPQDDNNPGVVLLPPRVVKIPTRLLPNETRV